MSDLPTVRALMDTTFVTLRPDMGLAQAIDILMEHRITGAAVVDGEMRVVGLLSEKDCLRTILRGAYDQTPPGLVHEYMTTDVTVIDPETDLFQLTELFLKGFYRRFPVVENGVLVGQITRRDLLRAIQKYSKYNA